MADNAAKTFWTNPKLRPREFAQIRQLAFRKFGLDLKPGKEELVSARLGKKLRQGGFPSFQAYYDHVLADSTGEELIALIDALTTNYTSFLREAAHFEFLRREVLPSLKDRSEIVAWCAACATGEEPYTLAFTLLDALPGVGRRIRIVASDISSRAIGKAQHGVYPEGTLGGLSAEWKQRFFVRGQRESQGYYRVRREVRELIEFRRINLIERYSHCQRYPFIFCRNVMIYFNAETKSQVVRGLTEWLEPDGYLFVGHSESLFGESHGLRYVRPAVYRAHAPARKTRPGVRA